MSNKDSIFYKSALGNVLIMGVPIIITFVLAFVIGLSKFSDPQSPFFLTGGAVVLMGWFILVASKWTQIRQGKFWAFGITKGNPRIHFFYLLSYILMTSGYLLMTFSGLL